MKNLTYFKKHNKIAAKILDRIDFRSKDILKIPENFEKWYFEFQNLAKHKECWISFVSLKGVNVGY